MDIIMISASVTNKKSSNKQKKKIRIRLISIKADMTKTVMLKFRSNFGKLKSEKIF